MTLVHNKGFGLLEVLISLLVISVGVAGIVGLQKHMRKTSAEAEEHLIAARLAQESFEKIRVFDKNNFATVVVSGAQTHSHNGVTFTVTTSDPTNVAIAANSGVTAANQLKTVSVDVQWSSLNQEKSKAISFDSKLSPVTTFKSDEYFDLNTGGSGSAPLSVIHDPTNPLHMPPVYDATKRYYKGDQMTHGGNKYVCKEKAWCQNDTIYGPGKTNFSVAWAVCPSGSCPTV